MTRSLLATNDFTHETSPPFFFLPLKECLITDGLDIRATIGITTIKQSVGFILRIDCVVFVEESMFCRTHSYFSLLVVLLDGDLLFP